MLAYLPLVVLGFTAALVRAIAHRSPAATSRRRALQATWVLIILLGPPLWLFLAATLGLPLPGDGRGG